jgi:septum formation protein
MASRAGKRKTRLVLASSSPRRIELLRKWGFRKFEIISPGISEEIGEKNPRKLVRTLSKLKAAAVARRVKDAVIVAADLVVFFRGRILGKPASPAEAVKTLKSLSGKTHELFTGVTVLETKTGVFRTASVSSRVTLSCPSDAEIRSYVATDEPLDKAGSYAIQGEFGRKFVRKLSGSYSAIMGLPKRETLRLLGRAGKYLK